MSHVFLTHRSSGFQTISTTQPWLSNSVVVLAFQIGLAHRFYMICFAFEVYGSPIFTVDHILFFTSSDLGEVIAQAVARSTSNSIRLSLRRESNPVVGVSVKSLLR